MSCGLKQTILRECLPGIRFVASAYGVSLWMRMRWYGGFEMKMTVDLRLTPPNLFYTLRSDEKLNVRFLAGLYPGFQRRLGVG